MQMGRVGVRWVVVRLKRKGGEGREGEKKNTFLPPRPLSQLLRFCKSNMVAMIN